MEYSKYTLKSNRVLWIPWCKAFFVSWLLGIHRLVSTRQESRIMTRMGRGGRSCCRSSFIPRICHVGRSSLWGQSCATTLDPLRLSTGHKAATWCSISIASAHTHLEKLRTPEEDGCLCETARSHANECNRQILAALFRLEYIRDAL